MMSQNSQSGVPSWEKVVAQRTAPTNIMTNERDVLILHTILLNDAISHPPALVKQCIIRRQVP